MTAVETGMTLQVLRATRDLLASPDHWCQSAPARDADGVAVSPCAQEAVRWCLSGALHKVTGSPLRHGEANAFEYLSYVMRATTMGRHVVQFNDWASHADVIALLDTALAWLEGGCDATEEERARETS